MGISNEQYEQLYDVDERDMNGEYGRMGKAINEEVFLKLNKATNNIGTSPKNIEIIIRNFENNIIDEDKFINTLTLFNKKPDDFGYEFEISTEDMDEFEEFFNGEVGDAAIIQVPISFNKTREKNKSRMGSIY